jgi:putative nucleotidyltransferase with HDIG domain/PAS domain S-box-containing protein
MRSNPALLNMLDFSTEDELESKHIWKHYCDPSEGRAIIEELLARGAVIDREVKLKKQDGTEFWASTTVRAVRDSNGRVTHFDGSIVDINPRKIMEDQLHESYFMATDALQSTVQAIMRITEIRDPYTAGHQERVAQLSRAIARELGVEENRAQGIYVAGILHDIGKIYVPSEILNKPGKITELEHNVLKTHVDVGYEILKPVKFPWPIAEAVYQHHERLDGSGYPRKLTEEQIILEARILGVADVVEAMSSHRPYRPALGVDLALSEIRRGSGKFFDPNVVEACLSLFEKGFEFRASS